MTALEQKQLFNGVCLCGAIKFKFSTSKIKTIYRCYCSLCRKQSGAASNTATLILSEQFVKTILAITGLVFSTDCVNLTLNRKSSIISGMNVRLLTD